MSETQPNWGGGTAQRTMWLIGCVLVFGALPMLADRYVYDHWFHKNLYELDWARLLRLMGWAPTWGIAALVLWLNERKDDVQRAAARAWYLVTAMLAGGLLAEIMKLLLRRERPNVLAGDYSFRPWSEHPFSTSGLAWPSSHTMVAFAAATAMARLFPRTKWVWYTLAAGCGLTRLLAHAHFFSDVTLGALMGWSVGWGVYFVVQEKVMGRGAGV
ncbi:MAG: phosphatase PAP2 family protein [Gemmatimonadaceae bacterium]